LNFNLLALKVVTFLMVSFVFVFFVFALFASAPTSPSFVDLHFIDNFVLLYRSSGTHQATCA